MSELDEAIRAKLAAWRLNVESLREHGMDLIALDALMEAQAAIGAVLDLHKATYYDGRIEFERREEPVFSADGTPRGTIEVRGDPLPPDWCEPCAAVVPCDEVRAIAEKLGVEVDGG